MKKLDVAELRSKIDMDALYVDFGVLRSAVSVANVARDSGVELSVPSFEGECRGTCPKCKKEKSFTVNINTNRFNCFGKGCNLKGGGAIDFFSKLNEVSAKDASHLLACAYGIQPYSSDEPVAEQNGKPKPNPQVNGNGADSEPANRGLFTRSEFDDLKARFERLSNIVWTHMLENDAPGGIAEEYDPPLTKHHVAQ
jgi:CHC2 zinc finger